MTDGLFLLHYKQTIELLQLFLNDLMVLLCPYQRRMHVCPYTHPFNPYPLLRSLDLPLIQYTVSLDPYARLLLLYFGLKATMRRCSSAMTTHSVNKMYYQVNIVFNGPACGLFGRFKKDRVLLKLYKQSLHSIFTESTRSRSCLCWWMFVCVCGAFKLSFIAHICFSPSVYIYTYL